MQNFTKQVPAGTLYIISAASGTGKTSLVKALIKELPNIQGSVSHTTRESRKTELDAQDYHFVSESVFKEMRKKGLFLEYAKVFGQYYGTSSTWVEETLKKGVDVVLEIDWQGARQVRAQFVEAISIFIVPPSEDALIQRLKNRDPDNTDVVESRMKEAKNEISHYTEYDFLVCNDQFEQALSELKAIVGSNRLRLRSQQYHLMQIMGKLTT